MSISATAASIRAGIAQLEQGKATLLAVSAAFHEAGRTFLEITYGTSRPEPAQAAGQMDLAIDQLARGVYLVDEAIRVLNGYLADVAGAADITPITGPSVQPLPPAPLPAAKVAAMRRELPAEIDRPRSGRKTHGRWDRGDGVVRAVVSGEDDLARQARRYLAGLYDEVLAIATHAETKVATDLRLEFETTGRPQHATVVINNRVCGGRLSCATVLPRLLPAGSSLTVYAPGGYRRTFTGGSR